MESQQPPHRNAGRGSTGVESPRAVTPHPSLGQPQPVSKAWRPTSALAAQQPNPAPTLPPRVQPQTWIAGRTIPQAGNDSPTTTPGISVIATWHRR